MGQFYCIFSRHQQKTLTRSLKNKKIETMMFKPSHTLVSLQAAHLETADFELGHHPLGGSFLNPVIEKTEKKVISSDFLPEGLGRRDEKKLIFGLICLNPAYGGDYKGGEHKKSQALLTKKLQENSNQKHSKKLC